ncbi:MAG: hypothetical protein JNL84_07245 [Candidatus Accumulibacter sp.]|nr:hypothetical protein [Accumulibacter sp.]
MPTKTSQKKAAATLPVIPKELIDQFVSGPLAEEHCERRQVGPARKGLQATWSSCASTARDTKWHAPEYRGVSGSTFADSL